MVLMTNGLSHGRLSLVFKKTNMYLHVHKSVSFSIFITWLIFYNPFLLLLIQVNTSHFILIFTVFS